MLQVTKEAKCLIVSADLSEEKWQGLEILLQTDSSLQYIYNKDNKEISLISYIPPKRISNIVLQLAINRIKNANDALDLSHLYISLIGIEQLKNLFGLILIHGKKITRIDLSHNGLQDGACRYIATFLKQSSTLKWINLSDNQVNYLGLNYLLDAAYVNQYLQWLDLSNNYIQVGKRTLKEAVKSFGKRNITRGNREYIVNILKTLGILAREKKFILGQWLINLLNNIDFLVMYPDNPNKEKVSYRCMVDLSRNFLDGDCEEDLHQPEKAESAAILVTEKPVLEEWILELLKNIRHIIVYAKTTMDMALGYLQMKANVNSIQESKEDEIYYPEKGNYRQYGLFLTKPAGIKSIIRDNYEISLEGWLVSFACKKKGPQHAMIYMEGMRSSGQRFLERYHITAEGMTGMAQVLSETIEIMHFKRDQYDFNTFPINHIQGCTLKRLVDAQKEKGVPFCKYFNSCSKGTVNCAKWAADRLREIDIPIEESVFPRKMAGSKRWCAIM